MGKDGSAVGKSSQLAPCLGQGQLGPGQMLGREHTSPRFQQHNSHDKLTFTAINKYNLKNKLKRYEGWDQPGTESLLTNPNL